MINVVNTKIKKFEIPINNFSIENLVIKYLHGIYKYILISETCEFKIKDCPRNQFNPFYAFNTIEELFCWYVAEIIRELTIFPSADPDFRIFGTYMSFKFTDAPIFFRNVDNYRIDDIKKVVEDCKKTNLNVNIRGMGVKASGVFGISFYCRKQGTKKLIDSEYMNYLASDSYDW